jgi:hypothetical protein
MKTGIVHIVEKSCDDIFISNYDDEYFW